MKLANAKSWVTKATMLALAAGSLMFAGAAKAQAQQFSAGVQIGQPIYHYDRDDRRFDRDDYRWRVEDREREQREEFARRQAYLRHEQWERQHRFDHDAYRR